MVTKISDVNKHCPLFVPALYWKDSTTKRHFLFAMLESINKATDVVVNSVQHESADEATFKANFIDTCKREFYKYVNGCNSNGPYIDSDKQFERACTSFTYLYNMTCEPLEPSDIHTIISDINTHINRVSETFNLLKEAKHKSNVNDIESLQNKIFEDLEYLKQFNHLPFLSQVFDKFDKYVSDKILFDVNNLSSIVKSLNGVNQTLYLSIPFYVGYIKLILAAYYDKKGIRLLSWWCKQRIDSCNSGILLESKHDYSSNFDYIDMQGNIRRIHFDNPFIEAHILTFNILCHLIAKLGVVYRDSLALFLGRGTTKNSRPFQNITDKDISSIKSAISLCEAIEEQILTMRHKIASLSTCKLVGKPEGINMKWNRDVNDLQNNWIMYINKHPKSIHQDEDDDYYSLDEEEKKGHDESSSDSSSEETKHSKSDKSKNSYIKIPVVEYKFIDGNGYNKGGPTNIKIPDTELNGQNDPNKNEEDFTRHMTSHLTIIDRGVMRSSLQYTVFGCELSWIQSDKHCPSQCEKCSIDISKFRSSKKHERQTTVIGDKIKDKLDKKILDIIPTFLCLDYYDILYDSIMATKMELTGFVHFQQMLNKRYKSITDITNIMSKYNSDAEKDPQQKYNTELELCNKILSCSTDVTYFETFFGLAHYYHKLIQESYIEKREEYIHKKATKSKFRFFALTKRSALHVISKTRQNICEILSCLTPVSLFNVVIKYLKRIESAIYILPIYLTEPIDPNFRTCIADLHNNRYNDHSQKRKLLLDQLNNAINYTLAIANTIDKKTTSYATKIGTGIKNMTPVAVANMLNKIMPNSNIRGVNQSESESPPNEEVDFSDKTINPIGDKINADTNSNMDDSTVTYTQTSDKPKLVSTTNFMYNEPSRISDTYHNYSGSDMLDVEIDEPECSLMNHNSTSQDNSQNSEMTFSSDELQQLDNYSKSDLLVSSTSDNSVDDANLFALSRYKAFNMSNNTVGSSGTIYNNANQSDDDLSIVANDALYFLRPFFEDIYEFFCDMHESVNSIFPKIENCFLNSDDYRTWISEHRLRCMNTMSKDESGLSKIIELHYDHFETKAREVEIQIIRREKIKTDGFFKIIHTLNIPLLKLINAYVISATFRTPKENNTTNTLGDTHIFLCGFYKLRQGEQEENV